MSRYTSARYQNADGSMISVLKDGVPHSIPVGHPDHADMVRENVPIAPYEAPAQTYLDKRVAEYGTTRQQIEYAVEHGFDALIERNLAIKAKYPKG